VQHFPVNWSFDIQRDIKNTLQVIRADQ
jgi:hypothetical protein